MIRILAVLANLGGFVGRGKERGNKSVWILNLHLDPQMCRTGLTMTLSLDKTSPPWKEIFVFISLSSVLNLSLLPKTCHCLCFKYRQVYFVVYSIQLLLSLFLVSWECSVWIHTLWSFLLTHRKYPHCPWSPPHLIYPLLSNWLGFPGGASGKEPAC